MNDADLFGITKARGEMVKAWCCNQELDCELKVFSNGARHAWGTCPICKKTNYKNQKLSPSLEDLKHRLLWIRSMVLVMPKGIDKDEAVCMIERLADELGREL